MTVEFSNDLASLLSKVGGADDPRTIFVVRYRGADRFVLAESEDEALAAAARDQGFQAGIVPVATLVAAMRGDSSPASEQRLAQSSEALLNLSFPNGIPSEAELNKLSKEQLQDAAQIQGLSFDPRAKKLQLIELLGAKRDGKSTQKTLPTSDDATG